MNIYLVEDDEMLRKSLRFFLSSKNFKVTDFDNGEDAINRITSGPEKPDLVITDLNLPFKGGQQVIQAVRNLENGGIPIIVLTSSGVEATELEVLEMGADEFMTKPFSPAILLKRIEKMVY